MIAAMPGKTRFLPLAAVLVACLSPAADALVRYDFEQPYLVLPGRYMKDHCFVRTGPEWHCFMITGRDDSISWEPAGNEVSFAHASTRDFRHWTLDPDVCSSGSGQWDERNIWAPDVIRWRGAYRMYYTGVDSSVAQRMGLAESEDLFDWRPVPSNPVFHPDSSWARWRAGTWSNCRDPDIVPLGDSLYALNTCATASGLGAVGLAASADGITWIDRGPLLVNDTAALLESVQLLRRASGWYLFFNEEKVPGLSVLRAPGPWGPWSKAGRRILCSGQPAEVFGSPAGALLSRCGRYEDGTGRIRYALRVDPLDWDAAGDPFVPEDSSFWRDWAPVRLDDPDPLFGETGLEVLQTDLAFALQPTFGENPSFRGEPVTVGPAGNSWIGTREAYRGPLGGNTAPGTEVGDAAVGAVRSRDFPITGTTLSFLIGGDADPERLYLALRDARTHRILARETGTGRETLEPRVWKTDSLYGRLVYLEIVDASPSGHLNLDEIIESGAPAPAAEAPFPGHVSEPQPNPFRAGTVTLIRIDRATPLTVGVFDAAGRLVRRIWSGDAGEGYFRFNWDGDLEDGRAAPSGTYFLRARAGGVERTAKVVRIK